MMIARKDEERVNTHCLTYPKKFLTKKYDADDVVDDDLLMLMLKVVELLVMMLLSEDWQIESEIQL